MFDITHVFHAAHKLSQAVYGPELFWHDAVTFDPYDGLGSDLKWRTERKRDYVRYYPFAHPLLNPGASWSTGGLALHLVHGLPAWIETPWGEWQCFDYDLTGRHGKHANGYTTRQLIRSLDLDADRSECGCKVFALRSVARIRLPPYEYRHDVLPRPLTEWIALCRSHDPPLPLNEHLRYLLEERQVA